MDRQELDQSSQLDMGDPVELEVIDDVSEDESAAVNTPKGDQSQHLRMLEALLFAATEPVAIAVLEERMPDGADVKALLEDLRTEYENRGVHVLCVGGKWCLRTAPDLAFLMEKEKVEPRRLSRAGIETLAIIAYHQPVTRAEIEEIRGVAVSKGTIDLLLEVGWIRLRGRRKTPGRPVTYGTSEDFLQHFGLEQIGDLPGMDELKAAGLLDGRLPANFSVPTPNSASDEEEASLADDEDTPEFQTDFLEGTDRSDEVDVAEGDTLEEK